MPSAPTKRMHIANALLPQSPAPTHQQSRQPRSSFESDLTKTPMSSASSILSKDSLAKGSTKEPTMARKAWEAVKRRAKEHHDSVNAAYEVYYSQGINTRSSR
ncbi:uncharacterized protein EI97DRAFT_281747 [Westerdykella ornata]|uniref:Uncharacterized protein n=1 Tax=Westerdykella ornata TaxID=318751 RepID=A0A6A6JND4_WESOR|nr:uncharacterized protein EI97DRAFT_281747 [Westerdykella ornata]KAF2278027.1 hypothetical protein EI97DRAFT_281747 [Westerdykella ornata]